MWTLLFFTIYGIITITVGQQQSTVCKHPNRICQPEGIKPHNLACDVGSIRIDSAELKIGTKTSSNPSNCDCRIEGTVCLVDFTQTDEAQRCYGQNQCKIDLSMLLEEEDKCELIPDNRRLIVSTVDYTCYIPSDGSSENTDTTSIVIASVVSALVVIAIVVIVLVIVILYKRNKSKKRKNVRHVSVTRYHSNSAMEENYNTIPADYDAGSRHGYDTLKHIDANGRYSTAREVPDEGYDKARYGRPNNGVQSDGKCVKADANDYGRMNNETYNKIQHNKPQNTMPKVDQDDYSHFSEQSDDYSHLGDKPNNVHDTGNDYNRLHEKIKPPAHNNDDAISSGPAEINNKADVSDIVLKRTGSYEEPTKVESDKHVNTIEVNNEIGKEDTGRKRKDSYEYPDKEFDDTNDNSVDKMKANRNRKGSYEEPSAATDVSDKHVESIEDKTHDKRDIGRDRKGSYEEPTTDMSEKQLINSNDIDNKRNDSDTTEDVNSEQMNQDGVQLPTKGDNYDSGSSSCSDPDFYR